MSRIERAPNLPGDFAERDDYGRELQVVALDRIVITYWTDDPACEVRVIRIEAL